MFVVLDRNHDADARILAQRNVPRPAPVAERGDERHRRVTGYVLERAHHSPGADVARAGEIAPQGNEAKIGIEFPGAELLRDERRLSRRVDQEPAVHAAVFLACAVEQPDLGALLAARDETFGLDVLEHLDAGIARIVEQQMIERGALDMQAGPVVVEIAKRDLGDFVLPVDDAAGLLDEAFALDALRDAEQVEIFPGRGQDAFAHGLAWMADLVDEHDAVAESRELGRRATAGGAAADHQDVGLCRDPHFPRSPSP